MFFLSIPVLLFPNALPSNYNLDAIPTDRHRANTKVEDEDYLLNEGMRFRHLQHGIFLTSDPLEYGDGLNQYIYVGQNPWGRFDPDGLATHRLDRQLSALSNGQSKPKNGYVSHSFNYTTNPDGSLKDTYSWGNTYTDNKGNWHKNAPEDVNAAKIAIELNKKNKQASRLMKPFNPYYGEQIGGDELDEHMEAEYQKRQNDPNHSSRHKWKITKNCKNEATDLQNDAKKA